MTDPFDWVGLARCLPVASIACDDHVTVAAYLRTRIEAAFVPVERYNNLKAVEQWLNDNPPLTNAALTARAEAAEARVKVLEKSLRDIRDYYPEGHRITELARAALGGDHGK